jgi:hypothetical protein
MLRTPIPSTPPTHAPPPPTGRQRHGGDAARRPRKPAAACPLGRPPPPLPQGLQHVRTRGLQGGVLGDSSAQAGLASCGTVPVDRGGLHSRLHSCHPPPRCAHTFQPGPLTHLRICLELPRHPHCPTHPLHRFPFPSIILRAENVHIKYDVIARLQRAAASLPSDAPGAPAAPGQQEGQPAAASRRQSKGARECARFRAPLQAAPRAGPCAAACRNHGPRSSTLVLPHLCHRLGLQVRAPLFLSEGTHTSGIHSSALLHPPTPTAGGPRDEAGAPGAEPTALTAASSLGSDSGSLATAAASPPMGAAPPPLPSGAAGPLPAGAGLENMANTRLGQVWQAGGNDNPPALSRNVSLAVHSMVVSPLACARSVLFTTVPTIFRPPSSLYVSHVH